MQIYCSFQSIFPCFHLRKSVACGICIETDWFILTNSTGQLPDERPIAPNFPDGCKNGDNVQCRWANSGTSIDDPDDFYAWDDELGIVPVCTDPEMCEQLEWKVSCCEFPCMSLPTTTSTSSEPPTTHSSSKNYISFKTSVEQMNVLIYSAL